MPSEFEVSVLQKTELLDDICSHVAGSGCPIEYAETVLRISWGTLSNWLRRDPERSKRFEAAKQDRDEYLVFRILRELRLLGTSDIRELFDIDGNLKPVSDWNQDAAKAVSSIKVDEIYEGYGSERKSIGQTKLVKFWDKTKSLELLGRYLKIFVERHEHSVNITLENLVKGSYTSPPKVSTENFSKNLKFIPEANPADTHLDDLEAVPVPVRNFLSEPDLPCIESSPVVETPNGESK